MRVTLKPGRKFYRSLGDDLGVVRVKEGEAIELTDEQFKAFGDSFDRVDATKKVKAPPVAAAAPVHDGRLKVEEDDEEEEDGDEEGFVEESEETPRERRAREKAEKKTAKAAAKDAKKKR